MQEGKHTRKVKSAVENGMDLTLIQNCGRECAEASGAVEVMKDLRRTATESGCVTDADYALYLKEKLPVKIEIEPGGLVMHIGKTECTCPASKVVLCNKELLCECTRYHEEVCWSSYFGKIVGVDVVESVLRGGSDCVIGIRFTGRT